MLRNLSFLGVLAVADKCSISAAVNARVTDGVQHAVEIADDSTCAKFCLISLLLPYTDRLQHVCCSCMQCCVLALPDLLVEPAKPALPAKLCYACFECYPGCIC